MKYCKNHLSFGNLLVLGVILLGLYVVLPAPRADECDGCNSASVSVRDKPYVWSWCDPSPSEAYHFSCGEEVTVDAQAAVLPGSCENDPSPPVPTFTPTVWGSLDFEVVPDSQLPNSISYRVFIKAGEKDKSGGFSVTASCEGNSPVNNGVCTYVHPTATGYVDYDPETCNCPRNLGDPDCGAGSVDFRLFLGPTLSGHNAGFLWLHSESADSALTQRSTLQLPFLRANVERIPSSGTIQQIKVPQGLVKVVYQSEYEYWLECYYSKDCVKNGNSYDTGTATPFVRYIIRNPALGSPYNQLDITENRNGRDPRQFHFTHTTLDSRWDLLKPEGQTQSTWIHVESSDITSYYKQIAKADGQVISKTQNRFQYFSPIGKSLLIQEIEGDAQTVTRSKTYTYYTSGNGAYKIKEIDDSEGNWVYYTYDSQGRKEYEYTGLKDTAPTDPPNPAVNPCKVTQYQYTYTMDTVPSWTFVSAPDASGNLHCLSKVYHSADADTDQELVYPDPENTPLEFLATSITVSTIVDDVSFGRPTSVQRPEGTTSYLYSYSPSDGHVTTVETSPDGSQTTTVVDEWGNPLTKVQTANGVELQHLTYRYQDPNTGAYYDDLRKSYDLIDNLAQTTTLYRFNDCCGFSSVIDPDGVETRYDYDQLNRQISTTILRGSTHGVKTVNTLDVAGQILQTDRIGTDEQNTITTGQWEYDVLGRVGQYTNALKGVTITTNVVINYKLYVTNTYPDGGIRVETYFRDGRLERVSGTAAHTMKYYYGVEQDADGAFHEFTKEVKVASDGSENEWTKTFIDGAGRAYEVLYSDGAYSRSYYNQYGRLWKERDPDGVWTLYKYDTSTPRLICKIVAVDSLPIVYNWWNVYSYADLPYDWFDPSFHFDSLDRITRYEHTVVPGIPNQMPALVRDDVYQWLDDESDWYGTLISRSETSADGLQTWKTVKKDVDTSVVVHSETVPGTSRTVTTTAPDISYNIATYSYGQLSDVKSYDSSAPSVQIGATTYAYDVHGRQSSVSDARNGATTYTYNDADLIASVTTPPPGNGQPQTTLTYYNKMLQVTNVIQPDGGSVTNEYFLTGELKKTYGARTYPVEYTYDYAGRMKTMKTWKDFKGNTGTATTTWNYHANRGWLSSKYYPDATTGNPGTTGPSYNYKPSGRLLTRTWARLVGGQPLVTAYAYNNAGDLWTVTYSDNTTPNLTYTYDRLGRQKTITRASDNMVDTLAYNLANELLSETFSGAGGTLSGFAVTSGYDQYLRRRTLSVNTQTALSYAYDYDNASRLRTVTDNTTPASPYSATYSYVANSPLVSQILFQNNGSPKMTTSKQYDYLNRLTSIASVPSGSGASPLSFSYAYNNANQRIRVTQADGSYWVYDYDSLGQVKSGKKYWSDQTPVAGQQFEYGFDTIGNRKTTAAGGDENGANLRPAGYTNNALNQITSRGVPGYVDVKGIALATSTVTVDSGAPYRHGEYFRRELSVANTSVPVWKNVPVTATGESGVSGNVFVPKTAENFGYDADGNLTSDGRWTYTWDAENRLIQIESLVNGPTASKRRVVWEFDGKGRRIRQTTYDGSSGSYVVTEDLKFLSDGWRHVAELNAANNALVRSYVWGLDLSGSMDGAGGVGGLLMMNSAANGEHFYAYDGNGNVAAPVKASDGTVSANYEYEAFGQTIRATGAMAKENPFRFSTKRTDNTTDLVLYEYRIYIPSLGCFTSRDPIGEIGGENLYATCRNNLLNNHDRLGLLEGEDRPGEDAKAFSLYDVPDDGMFCDVRCYCRPLSFLAPPDGKPVPVKPDKPISTIGWVLYELSDAGFSSSGCECIYKATGIVRAGHNPLAVPHPPPIRRRGAFGRICYKCTERKWQPVPDFIIALN